MDPQIKNELENISSLAADKAGFIISGIKIVEPEDHPKIKIELKHRDPNKDISIQDCALLNQPITEAIEKSNVIRKPFSLEISSVGISDLLITDRDFQTFKGFPIEVTYNNNKNVLLQESGLLHERSLKHLALNLKGRISLIPRDNVIKVELTTLSG